MCVHTELYVPPSTYGPTNVLRVIYMCYDVHYFSPISSIKDGHTSTSWNTYVWELTACTLTYWG